MDVVQRCTELESEGRSICHMEVGQPSTKAPSPVLERAKSALENSLLGYTNAVGNADLREAIAKHYKDKYDVDVTADRIVVTTGSSAGFLLSFLGCFDVGDTVALCSSGYPCYRNILQATSLECVTININSEFKIAAKEVLEEINRREQQQMKKISGLILSSPSNPTGVMLSPQELGDLCKLCDANDIVFISDEIYHGITYGTQKEDTALRYSDSAIVINSFSKYFSMTGWRLGWMVVPPHLVDAMNRLSQNIYINAPSLSQIAAIAAFSDESTAELEGNLQRYKDNRQIVLDVLCDLGLSEGCAPSDGAFYIYLDLSRFGVTDAPALCRRLLEESSVALTPGEDFEDPTSGLGKVRVRFSYSRSTEEVTEGMQRFKKFWRANMPS